MDSNPQNDRARRIAREFVEAIPHARALNMAVREVAPARVVIEMPYSEHLIGDPETGVIHGGAVSTLMDTCGGAAVLAHPSMPSSTATLDLRIDYMRPAAPGHTIVAEAICYHRTRSVAFVRAEARQDDGVQVAAATGAFSVEGGAA